MELIEKSTSNLDICAPVQLGLLTLPGLDGECNGPPLAKRRMVEKEIQTVIDKVDVVGEHIVAKGDYDYDIDDHDCLSQLIKGNK